MAYPLWSYWDLAMVTPSTMSFDRPFQLINIRKKVYITHTERGTD